MTIDEAIAVMNESWDLPEACVNWSAVECACEVLAEAGVLWKPPHNVVGRTGPGPGHVPPSARGGTAYDTAVRRKPYDPPACGRELDIARTERPRYRRPREDEPTLPTEPPAGWARS